MNRSLWKAPLSPWADVAAKQNWLLWRFRSMTNFVRLFRWHFPSTIIWYTEFFSLSTLPLRRWLQQYLDLITLCFAMAGWWWIESHKIFTPIFRRLMNAWNSNLHTHVLASLKNSGHEKSLLQISNRQHVINCTTKVWIQCNQRFLR